MLSLLLDAQDADGGDAMTDRELRDQLLTMLVAGHETTATALAWAFERLLRNPAVLVHVTGELAQGSTTYLDATIKETLRLRPVVPITARKITVPFEVGGRTYEPGTVLMPCIYMLHRHPDIYERPEEFHPERFIEHSPPPYSWIPFGGGVRRCLGSGFALAEMRAVMQTVLTRVQLAPEREAPERVVRRAFTISPREGARVVVQQRLGLGAARQAAQRAAGTGDGRGQHQVQGRSGKGGHAIHFADPHPGLEETGRMDDRTRVTEAGHGRPQPDGRALTPGLAAKAQAYLFLTAGALGAARRDAAAPAALRRGGHADGPAGVGGHGLRAAGARRPHAALVHPHRALHGGAGHHRRPAVHPLRRQPLPAVLPLGGVLRLLLPGHPRRRSGWPRSPP